MGMFGRDIGNQHRGIGIMAKVPFVIRKVRKLLVVALPGECGIVEGDYVRIDFVHGSKVFRGRKVNGE